MGHNVAAAMRAATAHHYGKLNTVHEPKRVMSHRLIPDRPTAES